MYGFAGKNALAPNVLNNEPIANDTTTKPVACLMFINYFHVGGYVANNRQSPGNTERGSANATKTSLKVAFLLYALALPIQSYGAAGDLDLSFDAGSSLDGAPSAIVLQPDGRIL